MVLEGELYIHLIRAHLCRVGMAKHTTRCESTPGLHCKACARTKFGFCCKSLFMVWACLSNLDYKIICVLMISFLVVSE